MIAYRATLDVTRRTGLVPAKLLLAEQTVGITVQVRPTPTCDMCCLAMTFGLGVMSQVGGRDWEDSAVRASATHRDRRLPDSVVRVSFPGELRTEASISVSPHSPSPEPSSTA